MTQFSFTKEDVTIQKQKEIIKMYEGMIEKYRKAILSIPEFIPYPWDWRQCQFCKGKRKHKPVCIRKELADED